MIPLTEKQRQQLQRVGHLHVFDSVTNEQFVLIRASTFEQLTDKTDFGRWTLEEMDRLHEEAGSMLDRFGK